MYLCRTLVALVLAATASAYTLGSSKARRQLHVFELPKIKYELPKPVYILPAGNASARTGDVDGSASGHDSAGDFKRRCAVTRGTWCGDWIRSTPLPAKPVPRGAKECPGSPTCSGWGNCNYDTGLCECPAGRAGPDCGQEQKRPCSNRYRHPHEVDGPVASHIGPDKEDLDITEDGWLASRCFGYCVDHLAMCVCGQNSTYRHIPAPPGSPPWTPPVQHGRPLGDSCMIGKNQQGDRIPWGRPYLSYDDIYGPKGWCNYEKSAIECGCMWDGNAAPCDGSRQHEPFCVNQCSGHGDCHQGYCRCHKGWYGTDCSRKKAGLDPMEPGYLGGPHQRPHLQPVVRIPPAALPEPPAPTRPRPLIYVYDVPPLYTSVMLQYRLGADACMWRRFSGDNHSYVMTMTYSIEVYLHEMLLQSDHRTFDPQEADFFYVPVYLTCYMWPVLGWADYPWFYAPNAHHRSMHVANMLLEVHEWLQQFPWWKRREGRDHIWLMAHDEGACYMPSAIYNTSIVLTHWGRLDRNHTSNSAYLQDRYHEPMRDKDLFKGWKGLDWQEKSLDHPCYTYGKDLVIPAFKSPDHYAHSPLLGAPPLQRDVLLYFRGDLGQARLDWYSRGIRQRLFKLAQEGNWAEKHRIFLGTGELLPGDYSQHLARSKFCLVAPGDGWSPRAEDAVLHGCVPLVIMDGVHAVFESILDWDSFSLRVRESALEAVPQLLEAVAPERLARMQRNLARVWHRFGYLTGSLLRDTADRIVARNRREGHPAEALAAAGQLTAADCPLRPPPRLRPEDDALSTILQWLHHRLPHTR